MMKVSIDKGKFWCVIFIEFGYSYLLWKKQEQIYIPAIINY